MATTKPRLNHDLDCYKLLQISLQKGVDNVGKFLTIQSPRRRLWHLTQPEHCMNRNIFTDANKTEWRDVAAAVVVAAALLIGALAYFDILTK